MFSKRAFNARRRKTQALAKKPVKVANEKPTTEIFVNQTVIPFKKTCDFCEEKRAVSTARNARRRRRVPAIFFVIPVISRSTATSRRRNHIRTQIPTSRREKRCTRSWAASSTCWRARSSWPSAASSSSASSTRRPRRTSTSGPRSRFFTSVLVFSSRRGDGVCSGPVRRTPAWRRSRSRRAAPLEVFGAAAKPAAEPTSEPTARADERAHRRGEREHAIAARDEANTQNQTQETSWRKPLCLKEAELCPYRPSTTTSSGSRRGRRVRGAFTRVDGVGMDAVARRWRGGGRGR